MAVFRALFPSETEILIGHYLRLEPADRELRFFARVSDDYLKRHCERIDWQHACLIGCFIDGVLRGVAELHVDRSSGPAHGEVSVSVEPAWQHEGIGTELLRRVLMVARNRLVRSLTLSCLLDNRPMQRLVRKFSDELQLQDGEVNAAITVPYPTLLSLCDEAFLNGLGWMAAWGRSVKAAQGTRGTAPAGTDTGQLELA